MSGKLKVFGVNTHLLGKQARTIAAVSSQAGFAAMIGTSLGYVRDYASTTENEEECKIALQNVGDIMIQCPLCEKWHKYERKRA